MACNLSALTGEQRARRETLAQQLVQHAESVQETEKGYVLDYQIDDSVWLTAAEFVDLERRCCSFFEFVLKLNPSANSLSIQLSGGDGVKEFVATQLLGANKASTVELQ